MSNKINVAVLGSTGYVGMELVKLLYNHEYVNINFLGTESYQGVYLSNIENTKKYTKLPLLKKNSSFDPSISDYVILALPHAVSNKYVKNFYDKIKIIDMSADFRFDDINTYELNYGNEHSCSSLLGDFIYGLPEINRLNICKARNIAVPGCYPTSILLPLIPLLKNNLIKTDNIIIDSKSGYSGAGKKFNIKNINDNDSLNLYNYNTNSHRHIPEIKQELSKFNLENDLAFSFNPHILPIFRGMMSTIYCDLNNGVKKNEIIEILKNFDQDNYFIKFLSNNEKLDFFSVKNSNYCKIKIFNHFSDDKIIIVSNIDNLIKGASGQAVQCLNLMEQYEENMALT